MNNREEFAVNFESPPPPYSQYSTPKPGLTGFLRKYQILIVTSLIVIIAILGISVAVALSSSPNYVYIVQNESTSTMSASLPETSTSASSNIFETESTESASETSAADPTTLTYETTTLGVQSTHVFRSNLVQEGKIKLNHPNLKL